MPNAAPDSPALIPPPEPALVARFVADLAKQRPLAPDERIGIAVSGGPDSLALLLLAHAAFPGRVEAATVDHGLRAESAAEAEMVSAICARLGVPHVTRKAVWNSERREGLQAAARDYRYRELASWCGTRRLVLLATAHHADDQAETLLMRLARGSGVGGLGSIRPTRRLSGSRLADGPYVRNQETVPWDFLLVRPLLRFTKQELVALVAVAGLAAINDPSNASDRFDRTRARRLLAETDWLDPARLAASASHLADADAALRWAADAELERRVIDDERNTESWLLDPEGVPDEILRRMVTALIDHVEDYALAGRYDDCLPSGPELSQFIARLKAGDTASWGYVLARPGPLWRFLPAPPRRT